METKDSSKVVRFRVSASELERLDTYAEAAKMSRSEYVRSCLARKGGGSESELLVQIAELLRKLQLSMDSYIKLLTLMMDEVEGLDQEQRPAAIGTVVAAEMEAASELKSLSFQTETLACEVLNGLRNAGT